MGFPCVRGSGAGLLEAGDSEAPIWAGVEVGSMKRWLSSESGEEAVGFVGQEQSRMAPCLCLLKPMGKFTLSN